MFYGRCLHIKLPIKDEKVALNQKKLQVSQRRDQEKKEQEEREAEQRRQADKKTWSVLYTAKCFLLFGDALSSSVYPVVLPALYLAGLYEHALTT